MYVIVPGTGRAPALLEILPAAPGVTVPALQVIEVMTNPEVEAIPIMADSIELMGVTPPGTPLFTKAP